MFAHRKQLILDTDLIDVQATITIVLISPFPDDHDPLGAALSTSLWTTDGCRELGIHRSHSRSRTVHRHPNEHAGTRRP